MKMPKKAKGIIWISILSVILVFTLAFVLVTSYFANQGEFVIKYYVVKHNYNTYLDTYEFSYTTDPAFAKLFYDYNSAKNYIDDHNLINHEVAVLIVTQQDPSKVEVIAYDK